VDVEICALIVRPQQESHFVWRDYARGLSDGVRPLNQISSRALRNWLPETGKLVLQQYRPKPDYLGGVAQGPTLRAKQTKFEPAAHVPAHDPIRTCASLSTPRRGVGQYCLRPQTRGRAGGVGGSSVGFLIG
jgi:hypothetical protein